MSARVARPNGPSRSRLLLDGGMAGLLAGLLLLAVMATEGGRNAALFPLDSTAGRALLHLLIAAALGAVMALSFRAQPNGHASIISSGILSGLLWWIVGPLSLSFLVDGRGPSWTLSEAAQVFPNLVSSLLFGGVAGLLVHLLGRRRLRIVDQEIDLTNGLSDAATNVVILGGGFGGVAVAQRLEQLAQQHRNLKVTLVSPSNFLLFTPMLAEVAASSLEPQHISAPIRSACPRTGFVRSTAVDIDSEAQAVHLADGGRQVLLYDHLVLALGSVPNYRNLPGVEQHSFSLKTLGDAIGLRNHVIGLLERADSEPDPVERRRMLTFVVAGGGFAGTEMVAELFDMAFSALRYYPNVPIGELRFVLVHSGDRLLPEIGPELADYAREKLTERGIEFRLGARVAGAGPEWMELSDGTVIPTRTLVWTAGNQPNPLLSRIAAERNRAGALLADETLRLQGYDNIWAVGDCAQIPDIDQPGSFHPPTAQHAIREGKALADNILAAEHDRPLKPFRFSAIGILVALGHRTAVAEIKGRRFSGLLAWMLWRSIYLAKLPGLEKKVRVLFDWTIDLFFARDIVLTAEPQPLDGPPVEQGATAQEAGR